MSGQLAARLASCSQASTSASAAAARRPLLLPARARRSSSSAGAGDDGDDGGGTWELAPLQDDDNDGSSLVYDDGGDDGEVDVDDGALYVSTYDDDRLLNRNNVAPDYDDLRWADKVTDWHEFWHESEDAFMVDMEADDGRTPLERSREALRRAKQLISQLDDLRLRAGVEQMISPHVRPPAHYAEEFTSERDFVAHERMHVIDPNPDYDDIDLRALSEKRARRAALDAKWEQDKALLGRAASFTLKLDDDVRLASTQFDWVREDWTHEQIVHMINGGGQYATIEAAARAAVSLNPYGAPDMHNEAGVHDVPETEEYIASIGHLATEKDIMHLRLGGAPGDDDEYTGGAFELREKDLVDPARIFEEPDGSRVMMDAPPNRWASLKHARDAADLEAFNSLLTRLAKRGGGAGKKKKAIGAGGADAEDDDDEELGHPATRELLGLRGTGMESPAAKAAAAEADDVMGEGWSRFVADDGEGFVFFDEYDDEGGITEAAEEADRDEQRREEQADAEGAAADDG